MKKLIQCTTAAFAFLFAQATVGAFEFAVIPRSVYGDFQNGDAVGWHTIIHLILHLIQLLITVAGAIAVIMIMIAGFQYIFATMYEDNSSAKNTIRGTLIGFVVTLLAWVIVDFVIAFLTK